MFNVIAAASGADNKQLLGSGQASQLFNDLNLKKGLWQSEKRFSGVKGKTKLLADEKLCQTACCKWGTHVGAWPHARRLTRQV